MASTTTSSRPSKPQLPDGRYVVHPAGSSASFAVAHFRVQTVRGTFDPPTGTVQVADGRLVAHGSVAAASVRTGTPPRDAHLRSYLFAAEDHPLIELRADGPVGAQVAATVWVRGRPVTVLAHLTGDASHLQVDVELDRREAGLTWPAPVEAGGVAVGRKVEVRLELALRPR